MNELPRRKQRGIEISETRRIPSAASCGEYDPKRFKRGLTLRPRRTRRTAPLTRNLDLVTNTNVLSNVTCSGKKAFGPRAMGFYLEGHPRQPLRLLIPTVWAWNDLHVPMLPVPQTSFPSPKSLCNIDNDVCIRLYSPTRQFLRLFCRGST